MKKISITDWIAIITITSIIVGGVTQVAHPRDGYCPFICVTVNSDDQGK